MVFKARHNNDGELDPNINVAGRPLRIKKQTNRELREREFLLLLRKLKPLVAEAINTASRVLTDEKAQDSNKLKAATIILQQYKESLGELYNKDYDEEEGSSEIQQANAPILSLTVLRNGTEE